MASSKGSAALAPEPLVSRLNPVEEFLKQAKTVEGLPEVLNACALPHRIDPQIVGILRGTSQDDQTNFTLFERLLEFPFVLRQPDQTYAYHDSVRTLFLRYWRESDPELLRLLNERLVAHYDSRSNKLSDALNQVESPEFAFGIESLKTSFMLEAIYHATFLSPDEAYARFETYFYECERDGFSNACSAILNATRDWLLAGGNAGGSNVDKKYFLWLDYFSTRLQSGGSKFVSALTALQDLAKRVNSRSYPSLKVRVLSDLGQLLVQEGKTEEAWRITQKAADLGERDGVDNWNRCVWKYRLARIEWSLGRNLAAEASYRDSQKFSSYLSEGLYPTQNLYWQVLATADLSGVLQEQGRAEEALATALAALDVANTKMVGQQTPRQALAERFMELFASRSPQLLDTVAEEAKAVSVADAGSEVRFHAVYAETLRRNGQLRRAEEVLLETRQRITEKDDGEGESEVKFRLAGVYAAQGHLQRAAELCQEVISPNVQPSDRWLQPSALYALAALHRDGANWRHASQSLALLRKRWNSDTLLVYVEIAEAELLALQGSPRDGLEKLKRAEAVMRKVGSPGLPTCLRYQAKALFLVAEWKASRKAGREAIALFGRQSEWTDAAQTARELANTAASQGDWEAARRFSGQSAYCLRKLADAASYKPDLAGNAESAQAMALLDRASGEKREERLIDAREFLRSAIEKSPHNAWFHLNLSYVCSALENWSKAASALNQALTLEPSFAKSEHMAQRLKYLTKNSRSEYMAHALQAIKANELPASLEQFQRALAAVEPEKGASDAAEIHSSIAAVAAMQGNLELTAAHLVQAFTAWKEAGITDTGLAVSRVCRDFAFDHAAYSTLDSCFAQVEESLANTLDAEQIHACRLDLARSVDLGDKRSDANDGKRLLLEIGPALRPSSVAEKESARDALVRLRQNIKSKYGIEMPGFMLRVIEKPVWHDHYVVSLDGVSFLERGPEKNGAANGLANIDSVFECLEAELSKRLADCFDFHEFQELSHKWQTEDPDTAALSNVLADGFSAKKFWKFLQGLLAQRVSIADWPRHLQSFLAIEPGP